MRTVPGVQAPGAVVFGKKHANMIEKVAVEISEVKNRKYKT